MKHFFFLISKVLQEKKTISHSLLLIKLGTSELKGSAVPPWRTRFYAFLYQSFVILDIYNLNQIFRCSH